MSLWSQLFFSAAMAVASANLTWAPAFAQDLSPDQKATRTTDTDAKGQSPASSCRGLAKPVCERRADSCQWIERKKKVDTRGRKLTPYCRSTGHPAKVRDNQSNTSASQLSPMKM